MRLFSDPSAFADRAVQWIGERRQTWRLPGLLFALVLFICGLAWAGSSTSDLWSRLRMEPLLVLLLIGAPVGMILNSTELYAISRIAGGPISWRKSLEITVFGNAANMLPLPGATVLKLGAMKAHGIGFRKGSAMILLTFAIWGGLAFCYSACALWFLGQARIALAFLLLGCGLLAGCATGYARFAAWRLIGVVALTRLVSFPLEAFRYVLAMSALGISVSFLKASVLIVASFVGSAVMLAPSGLGIGESVVALLSPLVQIDPALGFLAAAAGRVVWMVGLVLSALAVLVLDVCARRRNDLATL